MSQSVESVSPVPMPVTLVAPNTAAATAVATMATASEAPPVMVSIPSPVNLHMASVGGDMSSNIPQSAINLTTVNVSALATSIGGGAGGGPPMAHYATGQIAQIPQGYTMQMSPPGSKMKGELGLIHING